ncbi:MAG: DUF881 domain-containing protein [Tissierellia bacterium]|nr:DUF881 domain-containing protein [Tissierellia bacterium]
MDNTRKHKFTILFSSILLGIFISVQFKQNIPDIPSVTLRSIQTTKNEIDSIVKETDSLKGLIEEKERQIEEFENMASEDKNIIDILNAELEKNKAISGLEDVQGSGIIITLHDNMAEDAFGQEYDLDVVHDVDILRIINDLRGAGAEAISINDERILAITEIKCGGPIIRANGKSLGAPFHIKAIGDQKLLNAAINAPNTYSYALKNIDQINVKTTIEDDIKIPAYRGRFNFRYAKPLKEGD